MQIEIPRVFFENHLLGQMETILIQKGNSITAAVAMDMTREQGV